MLYEEVEVKFLLDDLSAIRQCLLALGATIHRPRIFEENLLFDTADHNLTQQQRLLRLRRDQRNLITYKEPASQTDPDFKIRTEYEIEVNDFAQAQLILEKLGFFPTLRYEKYRETLTYQEAEIVLDETPCGNFMEIEAPREVIRSLAAALGLDFTTRIVASYADIFAAVCRTYQLQATDMTFAAFRGLSIDLHACHVA
ncbi:MAG: class IV adenylate cyclase [Candidatus Tectimicrobiota bacterium]